MGYISRRVGMWIVVLIASLSLGGCFSPKPEELVDVQGVLIDSQNAEVEGVTVTLAGKTTVTGEGGLFEIPEVPPGRHELTFTRGSDVIHTETVAIDKVDTVLDVTCFITEGWVPASG